MRMLLPMILMTLACNTARFPYPLSPRQEVRETLHGVEISDPYRWLEDPKSAETRAWIDKQHALTRSLLDRVPGRERLRARVASLVQIDSISMPTRRGERYFYYRRAKDQEQYLIYMRRGLAGAEEVLLDPHPMSPDRTVSLVLLDVSEDGKLLAYGIRKGGEDELEVRLFDVDARRDVAERLPRGRYWSFSIKPDRSGCFYSKHRAKEGTRIYYHALGTDPTTDLEIFGKGYGPEKGIVVDLTPDGRYLVIVVYHGSAAKKTEVYYQNLAEGGPIRTLVNDLDARFDPEIAGDTMYLRTNWKAPRYRLLAVDLRDPARDRWREIIPESEVVIEGFAPVGGRIFLNTLDRVRSRVKVVHPDGKPAGEIAFPTLGSVSAIKGRWDHPEGFFSFSSFHVPTTIYRFDAHSGGKSIWARIDAPVRSEDFALEQVWLASQDGTKVPMFVLTGKAARRDGSSPALLYGYGGFNVNLTPTFWVSAVAFVEAGGVFALANLRGGGELGEDWHRAGMREKKQNTFDDFHAAAEWLVRERYTSPSRLAIAGGSNGGLLVGAAITQRPHLFRAAICKYPLLDMVRYHKFSVAKLWVEEYGSPDVAEEFRALHAYSPYHRVKPGTRYPAVMFVSGDRDTRVDPLHARKMAALLQAANGSRWPVLLHYETKAGHVGGLPASKQVDHLTDDLAFLAWQLGVKL
jgi:prolyl oligopeptidase